MTKGRGINRCPHRWTWVELELLRRNYADSLTSDLATVLGLRAEQVNRMAFKLGLKKDVAVIAETARQRMLDPNHGGRAAGFKPGHVPANKGKKMPKGWAPGRMGETQFKKGRAAAEAHNYVPIGTLKVNQDGDLVRKVSDDPSLSPVRRWVPVRRLVWEAAHGPVPDGCMVAFKPGRHTVVPEQITLDALELLTMAENLARNSIHNQPLPVREVMRLRGTLKRAINRRAKEQQA